MANIRFEFDIEAPANKVYQAITEADGIRGWWTTDTNLKPEVGSEARFGFGPRGAFVFKVAELAKPGRVAWQPVEAMPDWQETEVSFELAENDGTTKVNFGHCNFASEDGSFAAVSFNWAHFMMSLKSYVETGKGMPAGA